MWSILTNMSATSALRNLAATQASLAQVQNEISTGQKVSTAADNPGYYSIATSMRTSVSNLSAVSDALNLGSSVIGTAVSALSGMTSTLQKMMAALVSAQQPGTDLNAIGTQITTLQAELTSAVSSASFNGVNVLDGSLVKSTEGGTDTTNTASDNLSIVASLTGTGATTSVGTISVDAKKTNFGQGSGSRFYATVTPSGATASESVDVTGVGANSTTKLAVNSSTTIANLQAFSTAVGTALDNVNSASEQLGAAQSNITMQSTFTTALSDSINNGIGSLVDADMNEASTRLNALQTQQQLGVQALSVANQNSQLILKLFQ